jgi:hypothetical protein
LKKEMQMTMRTIGCGVALFVFLSSGGGVSEGAASQPKPPPLPNDVPGLIEALASSEAPPKHKGPLEDSPLFFPELDDPAQARVLAARRKLEEKGAAAFPQLIAHLGDKRYSCTQEYAALVNLSVGNVCEQMIESQVQPGMRYKSRNGIDGKGHMSPHFINSRGGVKKWWSTRSTMSLREMKIEALEWTIAEEEKTGFPDPKDRKNYLNPLQTELRDLKKQKK